MLQRRDIEPVLKNADRSYIAQNRSSITILNCWVHKEWKMNIRDGPFDIQGGGAGIFPRDKSFFSLFLHNKLFFSKVNCNKFFFWKK